MKNFLTDGLLDIAILLSLLRSDVHNLINSDHELFNSYPEIHEIILGSTSAYTQTHFHSNNWHNGVGAFVHPKSIDNFYGNSVFRDLHELSHYRRFDGVRTDVNAYLASKPGSHGSLESERANTSQGENGHPSDSNNNDPETHPTSSATEQSLPSADDEAGGSGGSEIPSSFLGSELTKEDMAMIDILYNQDIDLGVGRDAFDINRRKELEKDQELQDEKEREKERQELERSQKEEEERQRELHGNVTYVVDGETGEWIPVPVTSPPQDVQQQQHQLQHLQQQQQAQMQPLALDISSPMEANETSLEEAMRMLEDQAEPMEFLSEPVSNLTTEQLEQELQLLLQQQQQLQSGPLVQPQPMSPQMPTQANYSSAQPGMEQRWPEALNVNTTNNNVSMMVDMATPNVTQNGLIQNATLGVPNVNVTDFGFNQELGVNTTGFAPFLTNSTGSGIFSPLAPPSNASLPSNETSLYNIGQQDLIFPNVSGVGLINSTFGSPENFLNGLLEDDLNDLDFSDLVLTEELHGMQVIDEASSDSAASSLGSTGSAAQDFSDLPSSSPYDGVEGATGYSQTSKVLPKDEKYDPSYNDPHFEFNTMQANHSSNDTHFPGHESTAADPHHVSHNHSYPLKPGQEPRERKLTAEEKFRINLGRDQKRAKSLKIPFSCEEIITSSVERFNDMMTKYKLTEPQLQMIRDIRRRGKNKVAAQNCRKRKLDVINTVEEDIEALRLDKERLLKERGAIDKEAAEYRRMYESMHREVFAALRDDNGHPYDPSEFTLQQTSDGDVFIVPCNATTHRTTQDTHKEKTGRKRKGGRKGN